MRDHRRTAILTALFVTLFALLVLAARAYRGDGDVVALPEPEETTTSSSTTSSSTLSSTSSTTTSTTTPPTTEPIPTPEDGDVFDEYIADRVEAFYELLSQSFSEPSDNPEDDYPEFAELAAAAQLDQVYTQQRAFFAEGKRVVEPPEPAVGIETDDEVRVSRVIENDGTQLSVRACEVDDEDTVDSRTGEVLVRGVITIDNVLTLELIGDEWKITESEVTDKIEGIGGCYFETEANLPY